VKVCPPKHGRQALTAQEEFSVRTVCRRCAGVPKRSFPNPTTIADIAAKACWRCAVLRADQIAFIDSKELNIPAKAVNASFRSSRRGAENIHYGHGAVTTSTTPCLSIGISVRYMKYECIPTALHGKFTPYVTALDLVATAARRASFMRQ